MEKKHSTFTSSKSRKKKGKKADMPTKKAKGNCNVSQSASHTKYYRIEKHRDAYEKITKEEYLGFSESISGSSETYHCVHGPEGKQYSEKGKLKRNLLKELDPVPVDRKWNDECPLTYNWEIVKKLEFLITDPTVTQQIDRLKAHLRDLSRISCYGFKIDILDSLCIVLDNLIEAQYNQPALKEELMLLVQNMDKPILLNSASDVITYFDHLRRYLGFLGYLLMQVPNDDVFDLVSKGLIWQLSAPDQIRGHGAAQLRHTLAAAAPVLYQTVVRMLGVSTLHRYPTYLEVALLLACDNVDNCIEMMRENIIENIFYRFNPYFPERNLPVYDINPADPQDYNIKLGDSSVNISTTLSLLLVLGKTTKQYLDENPKLKLLLPCPDNYAQRCFIWAFRYECRARGHGHQRNTMTVIAMVLLHCFGDRLMCFSNQLMPDVMSLSVLTELPRRSDWISTVNFNTGQLDVQFKKILISLSVDMIKLFPYNKFMVESQHWLLGLMYLLDPGLCSLRAKWSPSLFAEIRKIALQALVCTLPLAAHHLAKDYGLIRRILWYIEWYTESPYELPVLYWCVRLLQVAIYNRDTPERTASIQDLFDTHGIIILIHLCDTLLEQKSPPVEKSQAIIALCLRLLTSAVDNNTRLKCCVYPNIKWPSSVNSFARKMLDVILFALEKNFIISDRWLIALLNFVWESIIWKKEYRDIFIINNGIFKLLDIVTMTSPPVQCIALALICDAARAGDAIGQLVTWRATNGASSANSNLVKRGATVASLLAAIFRDECRATGVKLNEYGILQDLNCPLLSSIVRCELNDAEFCSDKNTRTPYCLAAANLAGSRMSKAYAILHMLSVDFEYKVNLADEAYNLYKNVQLAPEDEAILVLCSYYLTIKLNEVWMETQAQNPELLPQDNYILREFLHIGKGWAKEIKRQQEQIIENERKKDQEEESSLYAFLGRVRLNIALDALREVRCIARSADRACITHALLHDAVRAHHRRSIYTKTLETPVLKTYGPTLDDQNITGQNVKVYSIAAKEKPRPRKNSSTSSS
ncbi:uncharacterized protein LOC113518411 [Galleria mellonella]|uniref:Uncharacterized protein LOC113518411 n=1 Tax=Galleria mellonella TaxID=7137 RepID=A0A6J1WTQ6_GALME|nr:uncharacterized protein LOC113518411 [Galleria mellonella]